ncbi:hypothetical protein SDC9_203134 [bioreactor metagenome]|uniref:Uncharacterized protein n=1 Tax=bioreactor metagenome TaxID=1076179 RepID=A0A645IX70_9ZZZZ
MHGKIGQIRQAEAAVSFEGKVCLKRKPAIEQIGNRQAAEIAQDEGGAYRQNQGIKQRKHNAVYSVDQTDDKENKKLAA